MTAYRDWGLFALHHGDCLDVLRAMPEASVDSVVTDPPYGLAFMGKRWDYDVPAAATWAEVLRVLKPGGHVLSFGGTRTYHRLACAIEDGGFEVRDQIGWVFGSGFPKSLDVSKAIDAALGAERALTRPASDAAAAWQGWGTALKPAWEPICVARKPLIGTVAANVLAHGTGALNIDGCRVPTTESTVRPNGPIGYHGGGSGGSGGSDVGRWPANLIHDGSDEVLAAFPQAPGKLADASDTAASAKTGRVYGPRARTGEPSADSDNEGAVGFKMKPGARRLDTGSAARFFYCSKASKSDRGADNTHPTVKPTDLMRYLCRLVTPAGGLILDPFMGSGSTGKAAVLEGFRFVGIERDAAYLDIADRRIAVAYFERMAAA